MSDFVKISGGRALNLELVVLIEPTPSGASTFGGAAALGNFSHHAICAGSSLPVRLTEEDVERIRGRRRAVGGFDRDDMDRAFREGVRAATGEEPDDERFHAWTAWLDGYMEH